MDLLPTSEGRSTRSTSGRGPPVVAATAVTRRLGGMAEYVFTLRNVRKAHGDKVVLDNVTL